MNAAAGVVAAMGDEGDLVAPRLARGCRCFAAWQGDTLIGYGWLSRTAEWIGELEVEITPAAGEAYVWNCVTLPPHRRMGAFRAVLRHIGAIGRKERLNRLWIGSMEDPAEKAVVDAGFVPILNFEVTSSGGMRNLTVTAVESAAPEAVHDLRVALARDRGLLSLGLTSDRSEARRH